MRVLFIGGTGIISTACVAECVRQGNTVFVLNRGRRELPPGATALVGDIQGDPAAVAATLAASGPFDVVADFIAFTPADIERDLALFAGKVGQFVFISSASAYQKPPGHYRVTEDTPLTNPHWQYSRDKIACEERLQQAFRDGFPVTIIRPSLTYGRTNIPLILNSWQHPWTAVDRLRRGQPLVIPGDGTSLWSITWNEDFARGFVGLLGRADTLGHAFHITTDEVLCWNQFAAIVAREAGVPDPKLVHIASDLLVAHYPDWHGTLLGDKIHSVVCDNTKLKRFVPGFQATTPWAEGVRRAIAWFEADPARQTIDAQHNARLDAVLASYQRAWPATW